MDKMIVDNAKVMSKGQITLPKEIRQQMGIDTGDHVTLIYEDGKVIMVNSAIYAMQMLQREMKGMAAARGLNTEKKINSMVKKNRREMNK
jgi:antitoxin PrlF